MKTAFETIGGLGIDFVIIAEDQGGCKDGDERDGEENQESEACSEKHGDYLRVFVWGFREKSFSVWVESGSFEVV